MTATWRTRTIVTSAIALGLCYGLTVQARDFRARTVARIPARQSTFDNSRVAIGAMAQAHSVSNTSSPWFGISASYRFTKHIAVGMRGFLPMSRPVDKSTYAIQAFSRIFCEHVGQNRFFFEPDYAMNFYDFIPFQSAGAAIGVLNRVDSEMSVGVTGGVEVAKTIVDSIGLEHVSNLVVYPKIGLVSDFYF